MRIKPMLPVAMALMISFSAWAGEAPGMDIIEYLGTYETARGKEIDPMLLENPPAEKPRSKVAMPKKKETKKKEPRKKEENDD